MKASEKTVVISWAISSVLIGLIAIVVLWSIGVLGNTLSASAAGPAAINLGGSGNFTILTKTGISTTGSTVVVGDIGVSPAPASYITGFGLMLPAANAFSTSAQVTGKVYAPDYANPTSAQLTTAILDMQNAYTDAMGRAPDFTELGAGNLGGMTLAPGTYKWGTGVTISTDLTLSGAASDVWIFQVAQNLDISSGVKILLSGGAQASNIFWVVAGQTTVGTTAVFNGTILDQTAIVLNTGAQLNGRALAQSAVTLDSNVVTVSNYSAPSYSAPTPTSIPTYLPTPIPVSIQLQSLTWQQQQQYNQLISAGASVSTALSAVHQIQAAAGVSTPAPFAPVQQIKMLTADLQEGDTSGNVVILQQFLMSLMGGVSAGALAQVGATGYFGSLTRAALAEFQARVGISPAAGYFGPITRSYISAQY